MLTEQEKAVIDMTSVLQDALLALSGDHELDHSSHILSIRDIRSRVVACSDRRRIELNAKP